MSSRTLSWLVLFVLIGGLGLRLQAHLQAQDNDTVTRQQAAFQYLRHLIHDNYVKEVEDRKLFYGAISGMAATLDRHSQFLPPEEYEQLRTTTTGQFQGVGIEFNPDESLGLVVLTPLEGTPAYKGGVFPGD
jgi:carboxyl-terminal processing protease